MTTIQTIVRPIRDRISVRVPKEYSAYSFHVILVPLAPERTDVRRKCVRKRGSFVDALLSCPVLDDGEELDVERDHNDFGRGVVL